MKIMIIGGGPGGYEAAIYAAKKGAEVTVVERDRLGGTCLTRGCIPTKAYMASGEALRWVKNAGSYGILLEGAAAPDYPAVAARKDKIVDSLVKGIHFLFKKNKIRLVEGTGTLEDAHRVKVTAADGSEQILETDYVILATGSRPLCPPAFHVDGRRVITSNELLGMETLPESLILVGGGVIGCEIGQFLAGMGTQVTVVEALPRLMATMDEDVSKQLARQFKKDKIKCVLGDGIAQVTPGEDQVEVELASGKKLCAAYVLVAIGRRPFTEGLGLEKAGVELTPRGCVKVDEYMRTTAENIYAIGDLLDSPMLAHVAAKEGCVAVDHILGEGRPMDYRAVPACVFTTPEIASVGTLEWQLKEQGVTDYKVGSFDFKGLGKAQASGHIAGFVKVIADAQGTLIGAEIVGDRAADMLQVLTTAVALRLSVRQVADSIFPHPAMCEAIAEALHDVDGMSIHKV